MDYKKRIHKHILYRRLLAKSSFAVNVFVVVNNLSNIDHFETEKKRIFSPKSGIYVFLNDLLIFNWNSKENIHHQIRSLKRQMYKMTDVYNKIRVFSFSTLLFRLFDLL